MNRIIFNQMEHQWSQYYIIPIVSEANELAQTISNWITKAQFIVNINILQRD